MRAELILEVENYGARWGLEGQRLFIEPVSALPGSLLQRLRTHRAALAPIVKVRLALEGQRLNREGLVMRTGLDRDTVLGALGALLEAEIVATGLSDPDEPLEAFYWLREQVVN